MILMSFNIQGFRGALNIRALKRMFENKTLDIVMLHETMCSGVSACETLLKLFLGWEGSAIDANGISGGLLIL